MNNSRPFLSIVAPAYNEEHNIERSIRDWEVFLSSHSFSGEIVVTDDGSRDRTDTILKSLQEEYSNLVVVTFEQNKGYGEALSEAINSAGGDFIATIDSDGQFRVEDIIPLISKQREGDFDLVTGYRLRKNDGFFRIIADRGLNRFVRILFKIPLRDTNCALKLIKRDCLRQFNIEARGYPVPTEIVLKAHQMGFRIAEVGIRHLERLGGESKLKFLSTSWSMFKILIYLKFKFHLLQKKLIQLT